MEYTPTYRLYEQDPPSPSRRRLLLLLGFIILSLYLALQLPSLESHPPAMFDESALSRIAWSISHGNGIRGDYIPAQEDGAFWLPPLYSLLLAPWFLVVGFGLYQARLFSLILSVAAFLLAAELMREEKITGLRRLVFLSILLFDPAYFRSAALARPEMLAALLLLAALLTLRKSRRSAGTGSALLAGSFSAGAFCAHPLALLVAPVLLLMLWNGENRWRRMFWFFLPHLVAAGICLAWLIPHWQTAYPQIKRNILFRKGPRWFDNFGKAWENLGAHFFTVLLYLWAFLDSVVMLVKNRGRAPWYAYGVLLLPVWLRIFTELQSFTFYTLFIPFALFRFVHAVEPRRTWRPVGFWMIILACLAASVERFEEARPFVSQTDPSRNYSALSREVAARLAPGSTVLIYGYPDVAMGLWKLRPDLRLRTFYWFTPEEGFRELRAVRYVVHARTGSIEEGKKLFREFWTPVSQRLGIIGRTVRDSTIIGKEWVSGSFSARIYEIREGADTHEK